MHQHIVIIGATSTIAELCAREWMKQENTKLILVGRTIENLQIISQDLLVRAPQNKIEIVLSNFTDPALIKKTVDDICKQSIPNIVLIAQGALPEQNQCQNDLHACKEALEINGISPILFAEAFAHHMEKINAGNIGLIGSVAGDRGRRSNYVYGAAKELLARYVQGMQHRFYNSNVKISLIKPGPTDTKMTIKLKNSGIKLAEASHVAKAIIKGINHNKSIIYTPKRWYLIMFVVRLLPDFIFGKINI